MLLMPTLKSQFTHILCVESDPAAFQVPEAGHEARLAYGLLSPGRELDLRVLHAVLGAPKRFKDLKSLTKGKSDTFLTRAIQRLGEQGLLRQGMTLQDRGDPRYYAATGLGVAVVLLSHELKPMEQVLALAKDAGLFAA